MTLLRCIGTEWLKRKRSLATWLVLGNGLFVPSIIFAVRMRHPANLPALYRVNGFWEKLWSQSWESMSIMMLPMFIILATSLIVQLEYKNNTWKQLHTSPQPLLTIYAAKLVVILALLVELFIVFNTGTWLTGVIPGILFGAPAPATPIPFLLFAQRNIHFLIDALPMVAIQYLLALHFRNFAVPLGFGMAFWLLGIGMISWQYSYVIPYTYCAMDYLATSGKQIGQHLPASIQMLALGYFAFFTVAGFVLYATKKERG
ncbi:MAG TPA: ABC transporter permease [Thermoanaerobaculia bacterium]